MNGKIVNQNGKLQDKLLPAMYFDSSVVIDYWMTEGLGESSARELDLLEGNSLEKYYKFVKELLGADTRLNKVLKIRKRLEYGENKITAEASNVLFIQRKSKKEIGQYLGRLFSILIKKEPETTREAADELKDEAMLFVDTFLSPSFAESHGLRGLVQADIVNFALPANAALYQTPVSAYAYVQIGTTDIMHILLAQHLGCNYFASFDDDFRRVKQIIKTTTGIDVLTTPEEILKVL